MSKKRFEFQVDIETAGKRDTVDLIIGEGGAATYCLYKMTVEECNELIENLKHEIQFGKRLRKMKFDSRARDNFIRNHYFPPKKKQRRTRC